MTDSNLHVAVVTAVIVIMGEVSLKTGNNPVPETQCVKV
jgi:hypothetical protein